MNSKNKPLITKRRLVGLLFAIVLITVLVTSGVSYVVLSNHSSTNLTLDVKIQPRDIKLYVGQTRLFSVVIYNGTSPYEAKWYSNGTFIGSGLSVEFGFEEPTDHTILSVTVMDSRGNIGFDSTYVYDPTATYITSGSFSDDYHYELTFVNSTHIQAKNGTTGTIDLESSNHSQVLQYAFDNSPQRYKNIFLGGGLFDLQYDVTYPDTCTIILQGEGSRYSRYGSLTTLIMGTVLYFNQSDFNDSGNTNWADGWTELYARDISFVFVGDGSSKGFWNAKTTLPQFDHVSLVLRGTYSGSNDILFGRGTGAVGRTVIWNDVIIDDGISGDNQRMVRLNFDSFIWEGGTLEAIATTGNTGHILVRLEATESARISTVSTYRDSGTREPIIWFLLTPIDGGEVPYVFEAFTFYEWSNGSDTTYHFDAESGTTVKVKLIGVVTESGSFKTDGNIVFVSGTTYSYLISTDGTTYYATNGTTDQIDIESTNHSFVFQSAIDGTPNGGIIQYKEGDFPIDYRVYVNQHTIKIRGAGLAFRGYTGGTEFDMGANGEIYVNSTDAQTWHEGFSISDIYFEGADSTKSAITFRSGISFNKFSSIYRCAFNGFETAGVPTIDLQNMELFRITDSRFDDTAFAHLYFNKDSYSAGNIYVTRNFFGLNNNNTYAIVMNQTNHLHSSDNQFYAVLTNLNASAFYADSMEYLYSDNDRCERVNFFKANPSGTVIEHVHIDQGSTFTTRTDTIIIDFTNVERSSVTDTEIRRGGSGGTTIGIYDRNYATLESKKNYFVGNRFRFGDSANWGGSGLAIDCANSTSIVKDNLGWNPQGLILTPTNGTFIVDANGWNTTAFANNTEYTCVQSPKSIYMQDGDTFDVYVNSQLVFDDVTQAQVYLVAGDTFEIEWVSALDILKTMGH